MRIIDKIAFDLRDEYLRQTGLPKDSFIEFFWNDSDTYDSIRRLETVSKTILKRRSDKMKKQYNPIIELKKISFKSIINYNLSMSIKPFKKMPEVDDFTGVVKISFWDGSILLAARYLEGAGRGLTVRTLYAGSLKTFKTYTLLSSYVKKTSSKPKVGMYRAVFNDMVGLTYEKLETLPETPVIHPLVDEIEKDINFYFKNNKLFTRFGMNGNRKFMLISEPGTGKSSLFFKLAHEHAKTKCVVFCTDIQSTAAHINLVAKHKVPSLVFLEDAESSIGHDRSNSSILNLLDGVDTPSNPKGTLIFMSTNFPERIEPRILKRPGRVDKIFNFGPLQDEWAVECAKLYFSDYIKKSYDKKEFRNAFHNMTGAQIKELAQASVNFAVSNQLPVDMKTIRLVRRKLSDQLSEAYKFAEENSALMGNKSIGFGND